jgi:hypothetical protein
MIRKPTSGDSEQRQHEAERARKASQLSAGGPDQQTLPMKADAAGESTSPLHGSAEGESAHGAIPRKGIEFEQGD